MAVEIRIVEPDDADIFKNVADGVFDNSINELWLADFLDDPRHHLAVAIDGGVAVGMVSAVHYAHPDKPPQLWINEVGVAPTHRGRGIGKRLIVTLLDVGRRHGCTEAWVLADEENSSARRLYESVGGIREPAPIMFSLPLAPDDVGPI